MTYLNGAAAASGTSLDGRTLRHLDARQKACLAANILAQLGPFHPTVNQLANMLRVSPAYIAVARHMSAAKRAAILAGYDESSFAALLNSSTPHLALPAPKAANGVGDAEIIDFVRTVGVSRVIDAACTVEAAE
jgi:hypothetical protein